MFQPTPRHQQGKGCAIHGMAGVPCRCHSMGAKQRRHALQQSLADGWAGAVIPSAFPHGNHGIRQKLRFLCRKRPSVAQKCPSVQIPTGNTLGLCHPFRALQHGLFGKLPGGKLRHVIGTVPPCRLPVSGILRAVGPQGLKGDALHSPRNAGVPKAARDLRVSKGKGGSSRCALGIYRACGNLLRQPRRQCHEPREIAPGSHGIATENTIDLPDIMPLAKASEESRAELLRPHPGEFLVSGGQGCPQGIQHINGHHVRTILQGSG